ncbi:carbohydrate-binding module family 18 protein, partial [Piromyces sp. E2]
MNIYSVSFIFSIFIIGIFANRELKPYLYYNARECNIYKKCPLKEQYRNSTLPAEELEKDKYHQCCSFFSQCGESVDYCGIGCKLGDCLPGYENKTRQFLICNALNIQNRCSKDCPCVDGACCSKDGFCGTTKEFCAKSNKMVFNKNVTLLTVPLHITTTATTTTTTIARTTTSPTPSPTLKIVPGMCGPNIGKCEGDQCCSEYGWCGTTRGHCYISHGCQPKYGVCVDSFNTNSTTTTTTTTTTTEEATEKKSTLATSVTGKCGEDYGVCPKGQCCSKHGWCGKGHGYCAEGCQP